MINSQRRYYEITSCHEGENLEEHINSYGSKADYPIDIVSVVYIPKIPQGFYYKIVWRKSMAVAHQYKGD